MRRTSAIAALAVTSAIVLAACGSDDGGESSDDATATSSASSAPAVTTESGLEVTGAVGEKPTVTIPADQEAPADLVVDVIEEGDGAKVTKGDWLVTNYLGQTWEEKNGEPNVFDNSWDRGAPAGFVIGEGQVIKGWDDGLVGQNIGSRVALTIPADQAYGGLEHDLSEDTLVFVVDILSTADPTATASGTDVSDLPSGFPEITSKDNGQPQINLTGATEPAESTSTLVVEGDGEALGDGAIFNYVQASYPNGEIAQSSWDTKMPQVMPSDAYANLPGLADALEGAKVGSRVVTQISGEENPDAEGNPGQPTVFVIDVIGTYTNA